MRKLAVIVGCLFLGLPAGPAGAAPEIHGFLEADYGVKLSDDTTKRDNFNLLEQRLQLKTSHVFNEGYLGDHGGIFNVKGDFTVDEYYNGKTGFDLRELNLALSPLALMDLKVGRQVLTWGTGDLLFINDMFPKDYVSFFAGRDDEYLKKPSDAVKVSLYPEAFNVDLVMIPFFEPNTTAAGDRLSFFDGFQGGIAGTNSDRQLLEPPSQLSNSEYALRLYRNLGSNELALYFFSGFDKNPRGYKDEAARQLFYPREDVYGASLRGPFARGIGNVELGYVNSRDDSDGTDRLVENSFLRAMGGYSQDLGNDLRVGLQYYYEQRLDYAHYAQNLLPGDVSYDEYRHVLTQRITKLYKNQTVTVSLFNFYSPSDNDGYFRPSVSYDATDNWRLTLGGNLPWGEDDYTEFGQMKRNKNIYVRARYNF